MKTRAIVVSALAMVLLGPPVHANDGNPQVTPGQNAFTLGVSAATESSATASVAHASDPVVTTVEVAGCFLGGDQLCAEPATCDNGDPMTHTLAITESGAIAGSTSSCPLPLDPAAGAGLTPGMVLAAFRRIPLPASELMVQPPGGRTLVNFDTNFYTDGGEFRRTVTLLGRRVELRIWPASFEWRFGDGESRQTTEPGGRYPNLEITHRYLSKGRVSPSVDTTYAAQFRVANGPWRDVNGTVTIPGIPEGLRVVTARPVLVGY